MFSDFLGWLDPSIVVRFSNLRARAGEIADADAGGGWGMREALAQSIRNSALCALYLAAARLHSDPLMTDSPSAVQTDHFHLPRPRCFSTMSNAAKRSSSVPEVMLRPDLDSCFGVR